LAFFSGFVGISTELCTGLPVPFYGITDPEGGWTSGLFGEVS